MGVWFESNFDFVQYADSLFDRLCAAGPRTRDGACVKLSRYTLSWVQKCTINILIAVLAFRLSYTYQLQLVGLGRVLTPPPVWALILGWLRAAGPHRSSCRLQLRA